MCCLGVFFVVEKNEKDSLYIVVACICGFLQNIAKNQKRESKLQAFGIRI
jgi:hypothetical protein